MVGEMTNRPMARIIAAGLKSNLDLVMHRLVSLNAIDIIDFDGEVVSKTLPDYSNENYLLIQILMK